MIRSSFIFCLLAALSLANPFVSASHVNAPRAAEIDLRNAAERSDYRATSTNEEVIQLIDRMAGHAKHIQRIDFGRSTDGQPLIATIAANPPVESPAQLQRDKRLVILLLGNIHSGECAGKEAILQILRSVTLDPQHPWLSDLVLLAVPNYNPDGNSQVGKHHRPGQIGPENGMGLRQNAQGLDLNRDFAKLDCPETRYLVALLNAWDPHVFIDTHTTNGSRHRYQVTYAAPHNPAAPAQVRSYLKDKLLPEVTRRLQKRGIDTFFYGNFNKEHSRWSTFGHEPRYSTEYMGLRGRLAILSEAYSYISYQDRIEATEAFVGECLTVLASQRRRVATLVRKADKRRIAAGTEPGESDPVPVRSTLKAWPDKVIVKGYSTRRAGEANPPAKGPATSNDQPRDYEVDHFADFAPSHQVQRPFAYVIPFQQSRVAARLRMHGIQIEQLTRRHELKVNVYQVDEIQQIRSAEHHQMISLDVTGRDELRTIPKGSYIVRSAQPLANLAAYLLEPQSDDGLATWGFFDHALQTGQDFPVWRINAPAKLATRSVDTIVAAQQLDLHQIYGPDRKVPFSGPSIPAPRWLPDSSAFIQQHGERFVRIDAATGARETLYRTGQIADALAKLPSLTAADARTASQTPGSLSPDGAGILLRFANDLFYYEIARERASRLTHSPGEEQLAEFSPHGELIAFVRDHNLFVVEVKTGQERALTTEGSQTLLHGRLDWVYQEELYGRGNFKAFWWSPDSRRIALLQLDETPVHPYTVTEHIPYRQSLEVTRYPKAGDPLPRVRLGVVPVAGGSIRWIEHPHYSDPELLIVRVGWSADGSRVVYQVQDRVQTWLDLRRANPDTGSHERLLHEASPAWVEPLGEPHWLHDGSFLWLSQRDGRRRIYHIGQDGKDAHAITSGDWSVVDLLGADPDESWVYFTAGKESPLQTQVYRIRLNGAQLEKISDRPGSHSISIDEPFRYVLDRSSDLNSPTCIRLFSCDGKFVRSINPNPDDHLKYYAIQKPELLTVQTRDDHSLNAMLIRPPDFSPSKRYPVICYVYSGPEASVVRDRWGGSRYLWHQMLAQRGYCIWMCDNRSATSAGPKEAWPIHRRLGQLELQDIEDGVAWLKQQPWVDSDRIGIWGWSYGGYMTSYALTHSKLFKLGIGTPVTDWRNYDAIYTERYMGLPQDNAEGYEKGSVTNAASQLHGRLLLIHGSIDDNVHLANTLQLSYELQKAGKQFDLMIYPKNRHGITQPQQSRHLNELMTKFLLDNL